MFEYLPRLSLPKTLVIASIATFVVFVVIDFIWLSKAKNFLYQPKLGDLLAESPRIWAAALFYVVYGLGLSLFVIRPALESGSILAGVWMGAAFGLVAYGTYDLTNQATIKGWSMVVTFVDMGWGAALTSMSSAIGLWIAQRIS